MAATCDATLMFPQLTSDVSHSSASPALIALCLKDVTCLFSLFVLELLWYCKQNCLTHVQVQVWFGGEGE